MSTEELRQSLLRLRKEIDEIEFETDAQRTQALDMIKGIELLLTHAHDRPDEDVMSRIEETVRSFEVQHPRLTATLGQIASSLSTSGI